MENTLSPQVDAPLRMPLDLGRLRSASAVLSLAGLALGAIATTAGTVVAGRVADRPSLDLVVLLAACLIGGAVLEVAGRFVWASVVDRAAGRLRHDLLDVALHQPLRALGDQAVGEVLDRIDDDTHEVGNLLRLQVWMMLRALATAVPMLVVAGLTWWPAWVLFPVVTLVGFLVMRPLLPRIAEGMVAEEAAWTDHAAVLEEGIAGRDDVRTSLGQSFLVARLAQLSSVVHERFAAVLVLERRVTLRAVLLLNVLLAGTAVVGAALVSGGRLGIAELVTLFLVTTHFVGTVSQVAEQLPELQAGLGAVVRLRGMLDSEQEPEGGAALPSGQLDLEFRDLDFSYGDGTFALQGIDLQVPAGATIALVGRTGSGKSTLASIVSRAVDPPRGTVFLGGRDVMDVALDDLRRQVGVVTQRTEILAGTLAENIALFADLPRERIRAVVDELGLGDWVAGLDEGLDTLLGPGGLTLSAGEEQLLAFARLLVRDVRVVVLDEATARMDPLTESRVVAASQRLLTGRTGVIIAHRLTTIERADLVAVLDGGRVVQAGRRDDLAADDGRFRDLLLMADAAGDRDEVDAPPLDDDGAVHSARRRVEAPGRPHPGDGPSLARGMVSVLAVRPTWGLLSVGLFLGFSLTGAFGALTGFAWGRTVEELAAGRWSSSWTLATVGSIVVSPLLLSEGIRRYPRWWIEVLLRVRMAVLVGQTSQRRLVRDPAGEVVARAMDCDRYARYADRWVDFTNGLIITGVTAWLGGTWLAGVVLLAVMVASALTSALGRPVAGRSAAQASAARARFGRALVSTLESVRTVKLAGRTPDLHRHLRDVDAGRVDAAVREHRVQAVLEGVPMVLTQAGIVVAWAGVLQGVWDLATALLVAGAVSGFGWFGRVAGAVVTEAPGTRAWQRETSRMAGGRDLMEIPAGVDLERGTAPAPPPTPREPLEALTLRDLGAVHEDGTVGVEHVDLTVHRGELVLLVGRIGSGKSSLLRALAGLVDYRGSLTWNGREVHDPELFLRPGQVAYVGQTPRVLSGTFVDNVGLGHERSVDDAIDAARLGPDVEVAGGSSALVGHRGVRLSGGQVQRLALARALAADTELLLADDVSSALDARTEIELWTSLRSRGVTVVGATSKRSALATADRVVVLDSGRVVAVGPWAELAPRWGHLAG